MSQVELEVEDLQKIMDDITIPHLFGNRSRFRVGVEADHMVFYIQLIFWAPDYSDYPNFEEKEQHCRKWRVSRFSTRTEVVETAFKACWMAAFHEMSEQFRYKQEAVYSPHFDIDARVEMCKTARFDRRED